MHALELREAALLHIREAYDHYEMKLPGLGEQFLAELDACFHKLEGNPRSYSFLRASFRSCLVKRFPYRVIFEIVAGKVIIYAIFHTRRHLPGSYR